MKWETGREKAESRTINKTWTCDTMISLTAATGATPEAYT